MISRVLDGMKERANDGKRKPANDGKVGRKWRKVVSLQTQDYRILQFQC